MISRQPVLFISHGGGPWPYIDDMREDFAVTAAALTALPASLPAKPKAIIAISGHWENDVVTIATSAQPPMVYDYSGFPAHTYQIKYSAPGSPDIAMQTANLLEGQGIPFKLDPDHGFDHGTFVPLYLMYPDADIPVISMSIRRDYDPAAHIRIGQALEHLRAQGVLIMGSGLTYHNLRRFNQSGAAASETFERWLTEAVQATDVTARNQKLVDWESAPDARLAHPREDHLIPLMVAAGAAGESVGRVAFRDRVWGITMASYRFDD